MCANGPQFRRSAPARQCDDNFIHTFALRLHPTGLADFEKLVIEAGAVDPQGLTRRIRDASRLLFLRESNGQLVGVGALKHPLRSYRRKVFARAGATVLSDEYPVELGWGAIADRKSTR